MILSLVFFKIVTDSADGIFFAQQLVQQALTTD